MGKVMVWLLRLGHKDTMVSSLLSLLYFSSWENKQDVCHGDTQEVCGGPDGVAQW